MEYKTTIAGLRRKRAHLAGEIEAAAQRLAKDRAALAALDATPRLFHPDADPEHIVTIRPPLRCLNFSPRGATALLPGSVAGRWAPAIEPAGGRICDAGEGFRAR